MVKGYEHKFGITPPKSYDPLVERFNKEAIKGKDRATKDIDLLDVRTSKDDDVIDYARDLFGRFILDDLQKDPYQFPREAGYAFGLFIGVMHERSMRCILTDDLLNDLFVKAIEYIKVHQEYNVEDVKAAFEALREESDLWNILGPQMNKLYRHVA